MGLLAKHCGDLTFAEILPRLRCKRCQRTPAPVYLCEEYREQTNGAPTDWAIELVLAPAKPYSLPLTPDEPSRIA